MLPYHQEHWMKTCVYICRHKRPIIPALIQCIFNFTDLLPLWEFRWRASRLQYVQFNIIMIARGIFPEPKSRGMLSHEFFFGFSLMTEQHCFLDSRQWIRLNVPWYDRSRERTNLTFKQIIQRSIIFGNRLCQRFSWYNNVPTYVASIFRYNHELYVIQTRSLELLHPYPVRTSNTHNALRHRIPELLCKYPTAVLEKASTHSIMSFTGQVKFHLLDSYCSDCLIPQCYICARLTEKYHNMYQ